MATAGGRRLARRVPRLGDGAGVRPAARVRTRHDHHQRDQPARNRDADQQPPEGQAEGFIGQALGQAAASEALGLSFARVRALLRRAAVPGARLYAAWDDQLVCVLDVRRVRWVAGLARTDALSRDDYRAADPDPTAPAAAKAAAQINKDHPEGLLAIAREFAGARGAVSAFCTGIDRYGIDLSCTGAGQSAAARAHFDEPLQTAADLRPAALELVRRARAAGAA